MHRAALEGGEGEGGEGVGDEGGEDEVRQGEGGEGEEQEGEGGEGDDCGNQAEQSRARWRAPLGERKKALDTVA